MDMNFLTKTNIFSGFSMKEIQMLIMQLGAIEKSFEKNTYIYHAGEKITSFGLVLSGKIQIENNDYWGNKSILDSLSTGNVFAETYALLQKEPLMVDVIAVETSTILFLDMNKIILMTNNELFRHFLMNILRISTKKNLNLSRRIFYTSSKTIRGRLLSYLSSQKSFHCSKEFDIPFNRQQMADYLNVDRSALSAELSKMKAEGILDFYRNHFILK